MPLLGSAGPRSGDLNHHVGHSIRLVGNATLAAICVSGPSMTLCCVPFALHASSFRRSFLFRTFAGTVLSPGLLLGGLYARAQGLQVTYGAKGVQTLAFNGVTLEDTSVFPADTFHIWHMKATDLAGNPVSSGQYGWGENNNGTSWNAATNTETYSFTWGYITVQFQGSGNNLNTTVTEVNYPGSGIIFDGAEILPFALHFPQDPAGFNGYNQYAITTTGPGVSAADFGTGVVTAAVPNEAAPLYTGWKSTGAATYEPIMTGTAPDGLATYLPHNDAPVQPGTSFSYTVSLRFTPEGTAANVADAYASFATTYPSQMTWSDKRIIGTAYLASSPAGGGDVTQPGGFPTNPRRYFNDASVDITNVSGLQAFQNRMLAQAASTVANAQALNAQGVITWDIEGEQYPQTTSYVCSPDQIAAVAPEMETAVLNPGSSYFGQKLDDAYFKTLTSAGLRVGLCLRPQVFSLGANGTASQSFLSSNASIIANLETKARYSNARWGATLFYVDSTVDINGGTLDPAIFQQLITDLPNLLFIPEESTPRYYAYTAPFYTFLFHTDLGTPASVYNYYPKAFGANLVNDVSASTLSQYTPQLTQSVAKGDILMGHADYWQANDPALVAIYAAAGVGTPTTPTAPSLSWPTPASITYGTALSGAQLDATANVAGTFSYSPAAGTVPQAGATTLQATFTPSDSKMYSASMATVTLSVAKATPSISWTAPPAIVSGTALSGTQLNATSSVAGTFAYSPAAGTVPSVGTTQLTATFTPADTTDYNAATLNVPLTVTAQTATAAISWSNPASITYGTALSGVQLNATANVPGSFAYSPSAGTVLSAGSQIISVTFTPADTNASPVTATRTLTITKATPQITWSSPAAVVAGTALSNAQLNATANVPGTFTYSPGAGTTLAAGSYTLNASFVANDNNFATATAAVTLTVNAASAPTGPVQILSPITGGTVAGGILVLGQVQVSLDSAGSYLLLDGVEVGTRRVTGPPYLYPLDTTTLADGQHTLVLFAHDIGNNNYFSDPVTITVLNGTTVAP